MQRCKTQAAVMTVVTAANGVTFAQTDAVLSAHTHNAMSKLRPRAKARQIYAAGFRGLLRAVAWATVPLALAATGSACVLQPQSSLAAVRSWRHDRSHLGGTTTHTAQRAI